MRISKMIVALLVSVVALTAMTGVAVADYMVIYEPSSTTPVGTINLVPNDPWKPFDLNVNTFIKPAGTGHTLSYVVSVQSDGSKGEVLGDIQVEFKELVPPGVQAGQPYAWTQDAGPGGAETLGLFFKTTGPVGAVYDITVNDLPGGGSVTYTAATISATNVPEFATIAIPAIAVLGLFLFFNKRKQKKA